MTKEEPDLAARRFKVVDIGLPRSRLQRAAYQPFPPDDVT